VTPTRCGASRPCDPHVFSRAGHDRWTIGVTVVVLNSHRYWNIGVKIGHTMHVIKLRVKS
jgi:hypothetical protein